MTIPYRGLKKSPEERFWERVTKTNTCWLYSNPDKSTGYGRISTKINGKSKQQGAHRFSYELLHGAIPDGKELDHICRIRHCVNPDHLEIVSKSENVLRGISPPAINSRKNLCKLGHNFETNKHGRRKCRICFNDGVKERRRKIKLGISISRVFKPKVCTSKEPKVEKTQCFNGHPYIEGSWRIDKRGYKVCRICAREYIRNSRIALDPNRGNPSGHELNAIKTHCPKGHKYNTENTWINKKGGRSCKACAKIHYKSNKEKYNSSAVLKRQMHKSKRLGLSLEEYLKRYSTNHTHCRKGHELTKDNTVIISNVRRCRICARINNHNFYRSSRRSLN